VKLLLASRSAARRQMLEAAGVTFDLCDAALDEEKVKEELRREGTDAVRLAARLAEAKALSAEAAGPALVLGADQTLELDDGSMLDKPGSREAAEAQLRALSGRSHRLHSAAALAEAGRIVWAETESATLHVRTLGEAFIGRYLDAEYETVRHGVGGYRIEGRGVQLFERIEGSHFAILGLPLLALLGYLRSRGVLPS
jgi:septum formation protein